MRENITVNENYKKNHAVSMMISLENGVSVEESVRLEKERLYLEYTKDKDLLNTEENLDKIAKRLEREKFNLVKTRNAIKSEIVVKKTLKINLERTNSKETRRMLLNLEKELFILNINCNLYNYAIKLKKQAIAKLNEKRSCMHHGIKRMRTKERNKKTNMAWSNEEE